MAHWTLFHLVAIVGLILANGFFVAAEFALVSLRATRVEQLIARPDRGPALSAACGLRWKISSPQCSLA